MSYYKKEYPEKRNDIFFLLLGIIGFIGGTMNFLPTFGIFIYPYGNFLIPIHSLCITYAILRYQLLDIHIVIRRGIVYSTSIAILSLSYLTIVLVLEKSLQRTFDYHSTIISVLTAFGVGLLFIPLRNRIQDFVDRIIFKGTTEEMALQVGKFKEAAVETDRYKTMATFSSGVAHEIKNPLTSIKTFCEYLPQKIHDKEFLEKYARIVDDQVTRINHFVDQLGAYGKPSPLNLQPTNIHYVVSDTLTLMGGECLHKKIKIEEVFQADQNILLSIDPAQINQVLINLIKNAIQAMPSGGILKVKTAMIKGKYFQIVVADTGCGIPKDELPKIFDPFFTKKDHGTGLGLSITQAIIERHHGKIRVESQVGQGTRVAIELKLRPSQTTPTSPSPQSD